MKDITISAATLEKLIKLHDPRAIIYYLYIESDGEHPDKEAASALGWSLAELRTARSVLENTGLVQRSTVVIENEERLPDYSAAQVNDRMESDLEFSELVKYTQIRLGRTLSNPDLSRLNGMYTQLGMSAGTVMLLISHCINRETAKSAEGNPRVSMYQVEREAYRWARDNILNESDAEKYVRELERTEDNVRRLARLLQINGRIPTASERSYLEKWSKLGLDDEVIYSAYDKTVFHTHNMNWKYMNTILERWVAEGVPSQNELEAEYLGDSRQRRQNEQEEASAGTRLSTAERLRRMRNNGENE